MERKKSTGTLSVASDDSIEAPASPGALNDLEQSELETYLDPEFDAVNFARTVLESHGALEGLEVLERQKNKVEAALSAHVAENNEELIGRLHGTNELQNGIGVSKQHANALSASLGRLGRDVCDPFSQMKKDAARLRNLLNASKVLDRTRRFLRAIARLKAQLLQSAENPAKPPVLKLPDSARDLAKAAQTLYEIELLLRTGQLAGIEVVDAERGFLDTVGKGIRSRTEMVLNRAITEVQYQSEVAPALQAFFNMGILSERVYAAVDWVVSNIGEEARDTLDAHALGEAVDLAASGNQGGDTVADEDRSDHKAGDSGTSGSSMSSLGKKGSNKKRNPSKSGTKIKPPSGQEKAWKAMLWTRVESLETSIRTWSLRIWNLQRVLIKKRDPLSHICFADHIYSLQSSEGEGDDDAKQQQESNGKGKKRSQFPSSNTPNRVETLYERYWRLMTHALQGEVERASRSYPFIRGVLGVQEYPRMRLLFRSMPARLARSATRLAQRSTGQDTAGLSGSNEEIQAMLRALQPLLEVFLAQSHHRLKETVELMFPEVEKTSALPLKQNALPTPSDVLTFAKNISSELAAGKGDVDLSAVIARGAGNAISLFVSKAEDIVVMDDQAFDFRGLEMPFKSSSNGSTGDTQGGGSAGTSFTKSDDGHGPERTPAQEHNVNVLKFVLKLDALVSEMPEKTTPQNAEKRELIVKGKWVAMKDSSDRLRGLAEFILGEYLSSAIRSIHRVISTIHKDNFSLKQDSSGMDLDSESRLSQAMAYAISNFREKHLDKLPLEFPIVSEICAMAQRRIVSLFCRHVSLVRPVNVSGRMRLTNELTQFELAVARLSLKPKAKLSELGDSYTELRALRQLLFLEKPESLSCSHKEAPGKLTPTIEASAAFSSSIRMSTILHTFFADAPAELRSPIGGSISSGPGLAEMQYVEELEAMECKVLQNAASAQGGAKPSSSLSLLQVGAKREEPKEVLEKVRSGVAASCDKYLQLVSAKRQDDSAYCVQFYILRGLQTMPTAQ